MHEQADEIAIEDETLNQEAPEDEVTPEVEAESETENPDETPEPDEVEEISIAVEGDSPTQDDEVPKDRAAWAKLRAENSRLKREMESAKTQKPDEADVLGPKPTLEGCDYDADEFEKRLLSWTDDKRKHDEAQAKKQEAEQAAQAAWQKQILAYEESKRLIRDPAFAESEEIVRNTLNNTQQALLVKYVPNAANAVCAFGKSEKHLKELASEQDPILFVIKARELEQKVTTSKPRKPAVEPERRITGSASNIGADAMLEKLRAEAEKTGDITKVVAYKAKLKAQGK